MGIIDQFCKIRESYVGEFIHRTCCPFNWKQGVCRDQNRTKKQIA